MALALSTSILSAQVSPQLLGLSEEVIYNDQHQMVFVKFKAQSQISETGLETFIKTQFNLGENTKVIEFKSEKDELAFTHRRFKILVNEIELYNKVIVSHSKNGILQSLNGDLQVNVLSGEEFRLNEEEALGFALKKINAKKYKWENKEEENHMRLVLNKPDFSYAPIAKKIWLENGKKNTAAYVFTIYAEEPLYKANVVVDANSGKIISEENLICTVDVPGIAQTKYSGTQSITCDQNGAMYTLKETQRGNGIETYNLNNTSNYGNATNFTNASSTWTGTGVDQGARDAHSGAEKTYDYYLNQHNRNSIDNNGFKLLSYIHYNTNYANAFWDGTRMTYGDGNGNSTYIFTTLDICAHEITHGLTSNSSNLVYNGESGALNESYSDIFGILIENYGRPNNWNWKMGEDMTSNGNGIRNMQNPAQFNDPDTYGGQYWYTGTADNGGVHTNSGVSNYWFYLLSMGGNGTNDFAQAFSVSGLGLNQAAQIAFRALTVYYTPNTNYANARLLSIQAAKDIFGTCSNQVIQSSLTLGMVGVGAAYVPGFIGANFLADKTTFCTVPAIVNFNNTTSNGISYTWNFGDGSALATSTNATHTYTSNGNFNVKLKASGCNNGNDSIIKTAYIVVNSPAAPSVTASSTCENSSTVLYANGNNNISWYQGSNAPVPIATGTAFTTPNLTTTTSYYAANTSPNNPIFGGLPTNTGGGFLNNAAQHLIFTVNSTCTLNTSVCVAVARLAPCFCNGPSAPPSRGPTPSAAHLGTLGHLFTVSLVFKYVVMYAQTAGNRIIELRNASNTVIYSQTTSLSVGANTVQLNFYLPVGTNYQLGLANGSTANLYRTNSGVSFPYSISGVVNITNSSAGAAYYYWFYNWQITESDCRSALVPVLASVVPAPQVNISNTPTLICMNDEVPLNGTPSGGTFSGNGVTGSSFVPPTGTGNYMVYYSYTDNTNCTGSDSIYFTISECVGLKELASKTDEFVLYPNPTRNKVSLKRNSNSAIQIEMSDAMGRVLFKTSSQNLIDELDLQQFSKGIYFISIKNEQGQNTKTLKLIKE